MAWQIFKQKQRQFFSADEQRLMVNAIQEAERHTSGEVRVFVEGKCDYVDPVDRAREIFFSLQMEKTNDRNAVLVYIAIDHQQLALFADEGIYQRMGAQFWDNEVGLIISRFSKQDIVGGICTCVREIGEALRTQFPYEKADKNELPDEIIFGK